MASKSKKRCIGTTVNKSSHYVLDRHMVSSMRDRYYEELNKLLPIDYNTTKITSYDESIMTRKWVSSVIRRIVTTKHEKNWEDDPDMTEILEKYDVVSNNLNSKKVNSTHTLILKPSNKNGPIRKIVPLQDSFDIVLEAHISTGHGDRNSIMEWLERNYFVNPKFAATMESVCEICKEEKVDVNSSIFINKSVGSAEIVDMTSFPDGPFNYLLIYQDKKSGFVQLRPLTKTSDLEISMELIKIFTDLEPPRMLEVHQSAYFIKNVEIKVNDVYWPHHIAFVILPDTKSLIQTIQNTIMDWVHWNDDQQNWAFGCHMVQWKLNTTRVNDNVPTIVGTYIKTPYEKMFGRKPNNTISNPVDSLTDLKASLHTEEDLGIFVDNDIKVEPETMSSEEDNNLIDATGNLEIRHQESSISIQGSTKSKASGVSEVCCQCELIIVNTTHKCKRCKKSVHFYCGEKIHSERMSCKVEKNTADFQVMCFKCSIIENKIAELKKKAVELDEQIRIITAKTRKKLI